MLTLYDYMDSGSGYKIRLLLSYLQQKYRWHEVDINHGGTQSAAYLKINPNGKIPAIQLDSGECLCESNAILYYLAQDTVYFAQEHYQQAKIMQWMFFEQYYHEPYIAVSRYIMRHLPKNHGRYQALPELKQKGERALKLMNQHLAEHEFFVGIFPSIADISLFAYTHVAEQGGFSLSPYRYILRWLKTIVSLPQHIDIQTRPSIG